VQIVRSSNPWFAVVTSAELDLKRRQIGLPAATAFANVPATRGNNDEPGVVVTVGWLSLSAEVALVSVADKTSAEDLVRARQAASAQGETALEDADLVLRLTGMHAVRIANEATLAIMLRDARDAEARFEAEAAEALRQEVVRAFDEAVAPSAGLRALVATALHDSAAAALAEGHADSALSVAREALRRFGGTPLDTKRHPPAVQQLFRRAATTLAAAPHAQLAVTSDREGELWADGTDLGALVGSRTVTLPWASIAYGSCTRAA